MPAYLDPSALPHAALLALAAGLLGFAAGWLIERTHFCTMGAISDAYLFGSLRRLRAWCLAIATALLLTQGVAALGILPLAESFYLVPRIEPLALFVGGVLFGVGMVLAGGCASRNLVRLGAGSLKALVVVLMLGLTAFASAGGFLVGLAEIPRAAVVWTTGPAGQSLGALIPAFGFGEARLADTVLALLIGGGLLVFVLKDSAFRRSPRDLSLGLGLGGLAALGFLVTGWLLADPFEPQPIMSLSYVAPISRGLLWLMTGNGFWPGFGAALAFGTILGSACSALLGRRMRIETFAARDDMIRHVAGGALMGFGGMLALGCTVGQGISGLATLAIGSFIAMAGIVMGALLALRRLERGGWLMALGLARRAASGDGA